MHTKIETNKEPLQTMESTLSNRLIGPRREKTCLWGFGNNKCADQPAHPCRLISAFVIRLLKVSYLDLQ